MGIQYCTIYYITVLYCTVLYNTILYFLLYYSTVLYSIVKYTTYCTVNAALYCIKLYIIVMYLAVGGVRQSAHFLHIYIKRYHDICIRNYNDCIFFMRQNIFPLVIY